MNGVPARAFLGLGANLGDARATLARAVNDLADVADTRVVAQSSLYRTAPVDSSGPDYLNLVVAVDTTLAPMVLLRRLQAIEAAHGRQRPYRNAPRTLDLDLLLYADQRIDLPDLQVPHPRLHQRAFVVVPLLEVAPSLCLPDGSRLADHVAAVAGQAIERLTGRPGSPSIQSGRPGGPSI